MPLSDHERQLLDQIEQGLAAERPRRTAALWPRAARIGHQVSVLTAIVGALAGLALLYVGLRLAGVDPTSQLTRELGTALGVVGYALITVACHAATRSILDSRARSPLDS